MMDKHHHRGVTSRTSVDEASTEGRGTATLVSTRRSLCCLVRGCHPDQLCQRYLLPGTREGQLRRGMPVYTAVQRCRYGIRGAEYIGRQQGRTKNRESKSEETCERAVRPGGFAFACFESAPGRWFCACEVVASCLDEKEHGACFAVFRGES